MATKKTNEEHMAAVLMQVKGVSDFKDALAAWTQAQTRAIEAKHRADVAYAAAYHAACTMTNDNGKPLTEKAKDTYAFTETQDEAFAAQMADVEAKTWYNLMLKWRDNEPGQESHE